MILVSAKAPSDRRIPRLIADSTWQAGRSPRNSHYRATLNGEPCPLAVAANVSEGWLLSLIDSEYGYMGTDSLGEPATVRLYGVVQLLRCRGE